MLKIIEITNANIDLLREYIKNTIFPNTFRYFNNRNIDCVKNHILTLLLINNDSISLITKSIHLLNPHIRIHIFNGLLENESSG